jgi:hypothetical protein
MEPPTCCLCELPMTRCAHQTPTATRWQCLDCDVLLLVPGRLALTDRDVDNRGAKKEAPQRSTCEASRSNKPSL